MRLLLKNLKDTTIHWTSPNHFTSLNAKIKFVLYTEPRRNHLHGTSITTIGNFILSHQITSLFFFKKILFLPTLDLRCCTWASSSFGERRATVVHGLPTVGAPLVVGFPGGLDGKESACNVGDRGLIPGLGRSPREGNGNPLQYSWLEKFMEREAWWATVRGVTGSDMTGWPALHTSLLLLGGTGSGGWAL